VDSMNLKKSLELFILRDGDFWLDSWNLNNLGCTL